MMNNPNPALPYTDTKSKGAADFYMAINATFRFVADRLGKEALIRYWSDLGSRYYQPVTAQWREGGFAAVAQYWQAFFRAEPGAKVTIHTEDREVRLEIEVCPAISHLRSQRRTIAPCYCQHCFYVTDAMASPAGLTVRIEGGNGSCVQRFVPRSSPGLAPQDFDLIKEAV